MPPLKRLPGPAPWRMLLTLPTLLRKGGTLRTEPWHWQAEPLRERDWQPFVQQLGYPNADAPPLCFHYLALQRAQLQAMLAPGFPHPLPGMVHLAQRFIRLRDWQPLPWQLTLAMTEEPAPRGALQLRLASDVLQEGRAVLRAESLYLARRGARAAPSAPKPAPAAEPAIAQWMLDAAAGRRHARLSGDWNPIHLWPWTARLFGLRRPIIHGMHSAARCEAELARHLGRPLQQLQIEFRRPLFLPGEARLVLQGEQGFRLLDGAGQRAAQGSWL
jgi:MaoC like domain